MVNYLKMNIKDSKSLNTTFSLSHIDTLVVVSYTVATSALGQSAIGNTGPSDLHNKNDFSHTHLPQAWLFVPRQPIVSPSPGICSRTIRYYYPAWINMTEIQLRPCMFEQGKDFMPADMDAKAKSGNDCLQYESIYIQLIFGIVVYSVGINSTSYDVQI